MKQVIRGMGAAILLGGLSSVAMAQTAKTFDVADVHPSPHRANPFVRGGKIPGDRYLLRDATMVDLIARGYDVDPINVSGGPPWLEYDRFDIYASTPPKTSDEAVANMLRALLNQRFQLVAHTGSKPVSAFVLSAGRNPKLKKSDGEPNPEGCQFQEPAKGAAPGTPGYVKFSCHDTTMNAFVEFLHDVAEPYLPRPVVDGTGLKGAWDFDIQWSYQPPHGGSDGLTIFDAVEKQLGLKLELKPTPMPVVVIHSVNEKPTANVPGIEKALPPAPPAQFEVAVIRPVNPEEKHYNLDMDPSGKITIQHASPQTLITFAWDIGPGKIENKPKWLNDDLYDIAGKASTDSRPALPDAVADLYIDDIKEMLRSLMAERFKMASHMEERPFAGFALVAANPKMKKADPTNHTSCKEGPGADGKDPRLENPILSRLFSCQNMTMQQFAIELQTMGAGYLPGPVLDSTGLTGAYDFTLNFSRKRDLRAAAGPAPSADEASASDPSAGLSLFDAMSKQLGLKIEKREKVPQPVLVIDHIEEQPTEN